MNLRLMALLFALLAGFCACDRQGPAGPPSAPSAPSTTPAANPVSDKLDPPGALTRFGIPPSGEFTHASRVAISDDASLVATGDEHGDIRVWEMPSGRLSLLLDLHDDNGTRDRYSDILDLEFCQDGQRLASVGIDKTVRIWDLKDGRQLNFVRFKGEGPLSVGWSPDGRTLAVGCWKSRVVLWAPGEENFRWDTGANAWDSSTVVFSKDGLRIFVANGQWTTNVLSAESGASLGELPGVRLVSGRGAFDPVANVIVEATRDEIVLLDAASGDLKHRLPFVNQGRVRVLIAPNGGPLVVDNESGELLVIDRTSGQTLGRAEFACTERCPISVSRGGQAVAALDQDGRLSVWQLNPFQRLLGGRTHEGEIRAVTCEGEDSTIQSLDSKGVLASWDRKTGRLTGCFRLPSPVLKGSRFLPASGKVALHGTGARYSFANALTGAIESSLEARSGWMELGIDGSKLLEQDASGALRIVPVAAPAEAQVAWKGPRAMATLSADGRRIAIIPDGSKEGLILDTASRETVGHFRQDGPATGPAKLCFAPDGSWLVGTFDYATASGEGRSELIAWRTSDGGQAWRLMLDSTVLAEPAWASDGALLALGMENGEVVLISTQFGKITRREADGHAAVTAVMISRSGKLLVSGDAQGVVRAWSLER